MMMTCNNQNREYFMMKNLKIRNSSLARRINKMIAKLMRNNLQAFIGTLVSKMKKRYKNRMKQAAKDIKVRLIKSIYLKIINLHNFLEKKIILCSKIDNK